MAASVRASLVPARYPRWRAALQEQARSVGNDVSDQAQHIYFDNPGLDTITVRALSRVGRSLAYAGARILRLQVAFNMDADGRAARNLAALPKTGYDTLMVAGVAAGKSLGYFRGGRVSTRLWWDSERAEAVPAFDELHPRPRVRRFSPPQSLRDLAADIDDLYWADAYGQSIKVTRVGQGEDRRWLVSLPGTDHSQFETQSNPADLEANLREELNMPNAMRRGTIDTIRLAMAADGLTSEETADERVLICGHSQGGMIAVGLASADPKDIGFTVDRVLTLGSPTRRLHLRRDAVAVAVEHDQDIVPALDATPRRNVDQRVTVQRTLNAPRMNPLFYAHASSTYTETVRRMEAQQQVAPWGRTGKAIEALQEYLPKEGEATRVFHLYTWQEIREVTDKYPWNEMFDVQLPQGWEPVRYEGEIEVDPEAARLVKDRLADLADTLISDAHVALNEALKSAPEPSTVSETDGNAPGEEVLP